MLIALLTIIGLALTGFIFRSTELIFFATGLFFGIYMVIRFPQTFKKFMVAPPDLVALVRTYAVEIKNGRTAANIYEHYLTEVEELRSEIEGDGNGADGVVGESIDIIVCLLDQIFTHSPHLTDDDIAAIAERKLIKWKRYYSHSLTRERHSDV